jgi:probable rRNA maturation factor
LNLDLVVERAAHPWPPAPDWAESARQLVASAGPKDGILEVILTGDAALQELNREFRGKDAPTDVLSFSHLSGHEDAREALVQGGVDPTAYCDEPHPVGLDDFVVGQVYISLETVRNRPPREGRTIPEEVLFLVAHGLLHVFGYDHAEDEAAAEMRGRERELLAGVGLSLAPEATGGEGS